MDQLFHQFLNLFHPDTLDQFIQSYGLWTYLVLFAIVFAETGLVVTPILPGDSLLFAAGALAARMSDRQGPALQVGVLFVLLAFAAIAGDTVNYWVGKYLGPRLLRNPNGRFLKKDYLDRTHAFFEKYGGKTIILARFVPIIRTFAPFVAGIGAMTYPKFLAYNILGGILWVAICVFAGYFFGNLDVVKKHFTLVLVAIVFISVLPGIIEYVRHRSREVTKNSTTPS